VQTAQLKTTQLGGTGLQITGVGFGAWAIGGGGWESAEALRTTNSRSPPLGRLLFIPERARAARLRGGFDVTLGG
jgi:hypothetical protein